MALAISLTAVVLEGVNYSFGSFQQFSHFSVDRYHLDCSIRYNHCANPLANIVLLLFFIFLFYLLIITIFLFYLLIITIIFILFSYYYYPFYFYFIAFSEIVD